MKTNSSGLRLRGKLHCGPRSGGSTNVEVADLLNRLPNAGLEHSLDSVHRRSLVLFHFDAAPRFLPFVLDGQRQAVAEPLHALEHALTRLHDHGTSNCGGHTCVTAPPYVLVTSRSFIRATPLLVLEGGWTTTASVDYGSGRSANGTPREAMPQCAATAPPKTSRVLPGPACSSSPMRV